LTAYDYYKDKYGNNYIYNSHLKDADVDGFASLTPLVMAELWNAKPLKKEDKPAAVNRYFGALNSGLRPFCHEEIHYGKRHGQSGSAQTSCDSAFFSKQLVDNIHVEHNVSPRVVLSKEDVWRKLYGIHHFYEH
jgi:hypothetical protein